jgi:hypothetical protein
MGFGRNIALAVSDVHFELRYRLQTKKRKAGKSSINRCCPTKYVISDEGGKFTGVYFTYLVTAVSNREGDMQRGFAFE